MCKQAIFLSRLKFAILLMAGGIEAIPCFALPRKKEVHDKEVAEALYELTQEGYLEISEKGICLTSEMKAFINAMRDYSSCLLMEPGDPAFHQKICYLGEQAVVLENTGRSSELRLFSVEKGEFWDWIDEAFNIPFSETVTRDEMRQLIKLNELSKEEYERLTRSGVSSEMAGGIRIWMNHVEHVMGEPPCVGIRMLERKNGTVIRDLILYQGYMNLWYVWHKPAKDMCSAEKNVNYVEANSLELKNELLKLFWEGKEE